MQQIKNNKTNNVPATINKNKKPKFISDVVQNTPLSKKPSKNGPPDHYQMENFETENSQSNDTPRIIENKFEQMKKKNPEVSLTEPDYSMRKTLDQNDTVPLRPSLKKKLI